MAVDVRQLVDRVAAALGEAATPERVETVAALVLEAAAAGAFAAPLQPLAPASGAPSRASNPAQRAIALAYGVDRPGVPEALARTAEDAGCQVAEAARQVLDGYFSLIMLLDVGTAHVSMAELQQRLTVAAARFNVSVLVQHEWLFKTTRPA